MIMKLCNHFYFGFFLILIFFYSCNYQNNQLKQELLLLKNTGNAIKKDFSTIIAHNKDLAVYCEHFYTQKNINAIYSDTTKFIIENDILYKPLNDEGSAVFVSGYYPISNEIKKFVSTTNILDAKFKKTITDFAPLISQIYFIDKRSIIRIYPFIEVLTLFESKTNFEKKAVLNYPPIQNNTEKPTQIESASNFSPTLRGCAISLNTPVYNNKQLVGVVGYNITIESIKEKYFHDKMKDIILTDSIGNIIFMNTKMAEILNLSALQKNTAEQDIKTNPQYCLATTKNKEMRTIFMNIIKNKQEVTTFNLNKEEITLISYRIPELNWYLIKILKEE